MTTKLKLHTSNHPNPLAQAPGGVCVLRAVTCHMSQGGCMRKGGGGSTSVLYPAPRISVIAIGISKFQTHSPNGDVVGHTS